MLCPFGLLSPSPSRPSPSTSTFKPPHRPGPAPARGRTRQSRQPEGLAGGARPDRPAATGSTGPLPRLSNGGGAAARGCHRFDKFVTRTGWFVPGAACPARPQGDSGSGALTWHGIGLEGGERAGTAARGGDKLRLSPRLAGKQRSVGSMKPRVAVRRVARSARYPSLTGYRQPNGKGRGPPSGRRLPLPSTVTAPGRQGSGAAGEAELAGSLTGPAPAGFHRPHGAGRPAGPGR